MSTPFVQTPLIGRTCSTNQEYSNQNCCSKSSRQSCRNLGPCCIGDNQLNCALGCGQYGYSSCRTKWCCICVNHSRDGERSDICKSCRPAYFGRRRCRSESIEREASDNHSFYSDRVVIRQDCDKSPFRYCMKNNLCNTEQCYKRIGRKDRNRDFLDSPTASTKHLFNAYPCFQVVKSPSIHSQSNCYTCQQLSGSCENHLDLFDRHAYFSNKSTESKYSLDMQSKHVAVTRSNFEPKDSERYLKEVEVLRTKLRLLKDTPLEGKRMRRLSESECGPTRWSESSNKRARDYSPHDASTSLSETSAAAAAYEDFNIDNSNLLLPRVSCSNIPSSEEVTSVSSDSDSVESSACDENKVHKFKCEDDGKEEIQDDFEEVPKCYSSTLISPESMSSSSSLSHIVTDVLGSISLSDTHSINCIFPEPQSQKFESSSSSKKFSAEKVLRDTELIPVVSGVGDCLALHPSLRASLFSHVPPFINFFNHEIKGLPFPHQLQILLKWKMSRITPVIVRKTILNSGFKLVRKSNEWCGTWGKHMKSICFKTLRDFQKMNHFPGSFQIGRKDNLWRNLLRLMTKFGKKEFGFMPRTYVLPQDNKLLRSAWEKHCGKERWIVKPPASARGTGIKVIHKWSQIPKKCPLIVQKYISDPYLINGSKFDLRLYALVTSINPLRIYLYNNGLVRFASVKYSREVSTLVDRYMHLTNYSINKMSSLYTENEDAGACQGHKWTLKALWAYLEKEKGVNVENLWNHMVDLVIKTMISGESSITHLSRAHLVSRYCTYELFGVDILLDEDLKPWLLEVNISPSLHSSTPLDLAVKGPLVKDLMNIAGYQIPNKLTNEQQESLYCTLGVNKNFCYDKRLYSTILSPKEKTKHMDYQQIDVREEYLNSILDDLTPDDIRHLIQYEDELTQLGNFLKIFPTENTHHYMQFFEAPRYYNMLFDAWESRYCEQRYKGIELLEELCQHQLHLEVNNTQLLKHRTASMSPTVHQQPQHQEEVIEEENEIKASLSLPTILKESDKQRAIDVTISESRLTDSGSSNNVQKLKNILHYGA